MFGQQFGRALAKVAALGAVHRLDQRFPRREMPVERADAHARLPRDRLQGHLAALRGEGPAPHFDQALAVALRVRAHGSAVNTQPEVPPFLLGFR